MNKKLEMTVTLSKDEVCVILAEYLNDRLGDGFLVENKGVKFEVGLSYEDRPGGSSIPIFKHVTVKATKDD